jgi:regulator of replication initiation timing
MAHQVLAQDGDFEPIDRLEEKVTLLVTMVSSLRAEQAKVAEEHARFAQEIARLQGELTNAQQSSSDVTALREERDVIRSRVSDMLQQLEQLAV